MRFPAECRIGSNIACVRKQRESSGVRECETRRLRRACGTRGNQMRFQVSGHLVRVQFCCGSIAQWYVLSGGWRGSQRLTGWCVVVATRCERDTCRSVLVDAVYLDSPDALSNGCGDCFDFSHHGGECSTGGGAGRRRLQCIQAPTTAGSMARVAAQCHQLQWPCSRASASTRRWPLYLLGSS